MKKPEHETKPEGFHTEFRRNVRYIFWIGLFIVLAIIAIIKYFG